MRPDQRLRRKSDFEAVYKAGRTEGNRLLVVRTRPNGVDTTRFGFVTTKALGNAVVRNRTKRRLRALAAPLVVADGLDVVVSARKPAATAPFVELDRALRSLLARVGALAVRPDEVRS
jgi:ribonuclease P protein component